MMASNNLPQPLRCRLREYFHSTRHLRANQQQRALLEMMSPHLQGEVSWECHKRWLVTVAFLRDLPQAFNVALSRQLIPLIFAPEEVVPWGSMYIIERGIALYAGSILGKGKVWGQDVILAGPGLRLRCLARTMTYLEVLALSREGLFTVVGFFPKVMERIRWKAIQLAFRRAVVKEAFTRRVKETAEEMAAEAANGEMEERGRERKSSCFDVALAGASFSCDDDRASVAACCAMGKPSMSSPSSSSSGFFAEVQTAKSSPPRARVSHPLAGHSLSACSQKELLAGIKEGALIARTCMTAPATAALPATSMPASTSAGNLGNIGAQNLSEAPRTSQGRSLSTWTSNLPAPDEANEDANEEATLLNA